MRIQTDVKVELDAEQVDAYIWSEMDACQQAELLMWLGRRYVISKPYVETQMYYVKEEFDGYDKATRGRTIKFLEGLLGLLKGEVDE